MDVMLGDMLHDLEANTSNFITSAEKNRNDQINRSLRFFISTNYDEIRLKKDLNGRQNIPMS
jgi:hypothetical protein